MKKFICHILRKLGIVCSSCARMAKEEALLSYCKEIGIYSPLLKSSMKKQLIPHYLSVKQYYENLVSGEKVLDMGTGSGILALVALQKGAKQITIADINAESVKAASELLPFSKAIVGDLFQNINGVYDTIIFNAPWGEGNINKPYDYALFDNDITTRFLREVRSFLSPDGLIWLQYADAFPEKNENLLKMIAENGLVISETFFHERFGPYVKRNIRVYLYKIKIAE